MGRYWLLPGLLLSLPLVTGWSTSNCLVTEGSRLPLVSRYFTFCRHSKLSFLAACLSVSNLTQTLEVVPRTVEGLCLGGTVSTLLPDAFSAFPGLKVLALSLHLTRLLPGALRGLGQLQSLSFFDSPLRRSLFLPPDAFSDLISLQRLHISGPCLDKKAGIRLPPGLQWLGVTLSCIQDVGELAGMFPDLVQGSSSRVSWTLQKLDLSSNWKLKMASPGSLQGLQVEILDLTRTPLDAVWLKGLGLQKLDVLYAQTATAELAAEAVAHFELQGLIVKESKIGSISQEALASCHSLKTLGLSSTGLTKLPPGFLTAMPRLQRLELSGNQLQSAVLCMNETGDVSGLTTLDLSGNRLRILPPAAFSCLPHLRELLLRYNQLLSLEGYLFQELQQLETLKLDGNPLLHLGKNWLAALPALTTLSLLDTQIRMSPEPGFWGAKNLHTLSLKLPALPAPAVLFLPMYLTSLELHIASGTTEHWTLSPAIFPSLETLTISGGGLKLKLGSQNASGVFPALQKLSLLKNSLDAFCSQGTSNLFLWQLPKLQSLRVWGAGNSSRPCLITGLPSLRELKLASLQSITQPRSVQLEELVGDLPQLQALVLSSTGLKSLSAAAFQRLHSLQVLVLEYEKDLMLQDSLREYSPQMPHYIYILESNLACHCANAWMEPWVKRSTKTYIYIRDNRLCPGQDRLSARGSLPSFLWDHCPQTLELKLFLASSALVFMLIALPLLQEARNSWIPYLQALFRVWLQGLRGKGDKGKRFLFDVFVSHCRQDQGWVIEELLPALEGFLPAGLGLRLCLPERDFEPGKDVVDNVVDSMLSSRTTLCVLSGQALCNPRCRLELRLATSLLLAAPSPPVLLLVFLEPISRHQLPGYHRLARLLRRGDYCLWPEEEERKSGFWTWLRSRLG